MSATPLRGRRVLLTRPAARGQGLAQRLRALGAEVDEQPTIAFESLIDSDAAREAIEQLARFALVLFTSPTAVAHYRDALARGRRDPRLPHPPAGAVGPGTAQALGELGIEPAVIAPEGRAESLLEALREFPIGRQPVLLIRPEGAMQALVERVRAAGIAAQAVAFYRTVQAPQAVLAARRVADGELDAVVFASPSALRFLLAAGEPELLRARLGALKRIAIGPVTAAALSAEALAAHAVAERPTDEAVARALVDSFAADRR